MSESAAYRGNIFLVIVGLLLWAASAFFALMAELELIRDELRSRR